MQLRSRNRRRQGRVKPTMEPSHDPTTGAKGLQPVPRTDGAGEVSLREILDKVYRSRALDGSGSQLGEDFPSSATVDDWEQGPAQAQATRRRRTVKRVRRRHRQSAWAKFISWLAGGKARGW